MNCPNNDNACECREHKIAVLINAALLAAVLLDEIKDRLDSICYADSASSIVERIYAACEVLQPDLAAEEIPA